MSLGMIRIQARNKSIAVVAGNVEIKRIVIVQNQVDLDLDLVRIPMIVAEVVVAAIVAVVAVVAVVAAVVAAVAVVAAIVVEATVAVEAVPRQEEERSDTRKKDIDVTGDITEMIISLKFALLVMTIVT